MFLKRRKKPGSQIQLSIVLVVYDMPEQAQTTLASLSAPYQHSVSAADYEVIVIENRSANMLGAERAEAVASNIRYFEFDETQPTPVNALNFAAQQASGQWLAMMIDGARLLSPGVICNTLAAMRSHPDSIVAVPGYHLGRELQQEAVASGYDREQELELLRSINWPAQGYRLFDISCFSGSCRGGFFRPMSESNFLAMPAEKYASLGGYETAFDQHGGGFANLDLYKRACQASELVVNLFGEGTFHQFHGGATTGGQAPEQREQTMEQLRAQYRAIRGEEFRPADTQCIYYGNMEPQVHRFLASSLSSGQR